MAIRYRPLPYYGGKRGNGLGKWIAGLLPWEKHSAYIEPFAGMLGVLLVRDPVDTELVNDINDRVINWWGQVRDRPAKFGWLTENTPRSRKALEWAISAVDDPEETQLYRALAFHIMVSQSMNSGDNCRAASDWKRTLTPRKSGFQHDQEDFQLLSERLRNVQLDNTDALKLLRRTVDRPEAVIYCDPPYPSAYTQAYKYEQLDYDRLAELLSAQSGAVAVSGYPGEWDSLGWDCEKKTRTVVAASTHKSKLQVECLWRNKLCVEWAARPQR